MDTVRINSRDTVFLGQDSVMADLIYTIDYAIDSSFAMLHGSDNSRNLPSDAQFFYRAVGGTNPNYTNAKSNGFFTWTIIESGEYIITEKIDIPSLKKIYVTIQSV